MKRNEQQEIDLGKFIDKVKEKSNEAMNKSYSAEQLQDEIANMCLDCFRTKNDECEICLGHCKDQLFLNFEVLDAEELRHNGDGDND